MTKSKYDFKSIVLYDAEFLTHDAQYSLRRCIEEYSGNTRFFMVCHDKNKLLNPICSRFSQIYLGEYQKKYIFGDKFDERKFMQNQITLKKKMDGCLDCGISELAKLVETLYMHGYCAKQILQYFRKHKKYHIMNYKFHNMAHDMNNEKFCMLYIIMFFRSNQN